MTNLREKFEERYNKLNINQKQAVDTIDGPVLVVAGPGSGKTELLSIRSANILKQSDVLPSSILLLTFTESAAYNMRERLVELIGEPAYRIGIYTYHAFASDIISRYQQYFFDGAKFLPATEVDQINIIENILKNLDRNDSLGTYHPELGYIYLRDSISAIKDLKKGNYTPETYENKLKQNKKWLKEIGPVFNTLESISGKRKYSEIIGTYTNIYNSLKTVDVKLKDRNEIKDILFYSLEEAIMNASTEEKSTPLTAWKNKYTKKNEDGKIILKDADPDKLAKLDSLLNVYKQYQEKLYEKALFDFEDMIILANQALKEHADLRYDLQEKFQYIMIDEFQDTNDAQFNLVLNLLDNSVNENRPNILAVGDDDQAIYKFQGAQLNNIYSFINSFKDVLVVVLDKNYRSTQDILDYARTLIIKGVDRLETRDRSINKKITSHNEKFKDLKVGEIKTFKFANSTFEYDFMAKELKRLIAGGVNGKEIAVICRKHEQLKELANVLNSFKVPYSYEKRENVLEKQHIIELITILKYLISEGEELLPEILSYKFWNLERIDIWQIAETVWNDRETSWLTAMKNSSNKSIVEIAHFLIELKVEVKSTPLEYLIDKIIGTTEYLWADEDDMPDEEKPAKVEKKLGYTSPYKKYYFNNERFVRNKPEYLDFLFSLRTFIGALREFHQGKVLYAKDILEFLDIYDGNNLTLSIISPFSTSTNAVSLLTAHKAKGLEFEYVFLLSANQDIWGKGVRSSKITFPINMKLSAEGDTDDDKIRLLYVALTRAKHTLYITHHKHKVEFLVNKDDVDEKIDNTEVSDDTMNSLELLPLNIYLENEKILLNRLLENYKMPVTHLNNYLNFVKVGPTKFIEQNLLRFPQAITPSSAYGSAMHEAIEKYFMYYNKFDKTPDLEFVKDSFTKNLEKARLPQNEYKKYLKSGIDNLKIYFKYLSKRKILPNTKVEVKFANEGVTIGEVHATGNIDKMEFVGSNEIIVTDLKTGDNFDSWEETGLTDFEKIKLHFFQYQLAYYSLLLENSKTFNTYKTKVGVIEFLEANKKGNIITLEYDLAGNDGIHLKHRVQKLANIVYKKILNLEFPNTDNYPQNIKGIIQFENDLLNGKI